jgi:hypothetical protein
VGGSVVRMVPTVEENEPALQGNGRHMPANGHSDPAGHASHIVDAECGANVPAAHAVQTDDAGAEVKEPDSQGTSLLEAEMLVN